MSIREPVSSTLGQLCLIKRPRERTNLKLLVVEIQAVGKSLVNEPSYLVLLSIIMIL